ncbi:MAG TPA: OmpA family protein [Hyphomicrobiaceae bacterium]|jgi:OOP family OmpA-OmpF porin|nr:OmpA family protein [Hyphomicrobiaceae bacterium]
MRCNWRRWLWGVIPLVCASVAAVYLERGVIEKDLTDRATQALAASGAYWAEVNFTGRDVALTGHATADNEPPEAEAVLRKLWGVRQVNNGANLPPKVEPYLWQANRRGDRVRLYGHVPNRGTRQIIVGMTNAALPGLEITDRTRIGRGVPPTDTWLAGVSFALKQLAALKKGEVRLEDLALTISGEAENAAEYRAVSAALKGGLPKGITLAGLQVAAPVVSPYTWSAQFAGGQLVLSGHVADDSAKSELLAAAAAAPAGTGVVDRLETARGAPADFAGAAATLIRQIAKLQSGNAEMKDTAVTVGGVAADEAQAQAVREALRASMPSNFKLTDQIRVREPPKVEPKVEPKIEARPPAETAPPPRMERQTTADPQPSMQQPKTDTQPAAAAPTKAEAQPEVKAAAQPPADPQRPAPQAAAAEPAKDTVSPSGPAAQPETKVAVASPPPAPEAAPAPTPPPPAAAPPPPPAPSVATPAPAAAEAAPPAVAPAAAVAPAPRPEAAPPAADVAAACRDDLSKLAAANPIVFERGSAELDAVGLATLAKIAAAVKRCPGVRIAAEGHTDIEGGPDYNQRLSAKRAQAVASCLIKTGVGADQIETAGFGASRPVAPNSTAQARAKNRRTEILVRPK